MWEAIIAYLADLFAGAGSAATYGGMDAYSAAAAAEAAGSSSALAGGASAAGAAGGGLAAEGLLGSAAMSPVAAEMYGAAAPALAGGAATTPAVAAGGAAITPELSAGGGMIGDIPVAARESVGLMSGLTPADLEAAGQLQLANMPMDARMSSTMDPYEGMMAERAMGIGRNVMGGLGKMARLPGMANLGAGLMAGGGQQKAMPMGGGRPQSAPPSGQSNMEILQRGRQQSLSPQEIELLKKLKARGLI